MTTGDISKKRAAEAAIAEVTDGMLVGLGTGSTAAFAISGLGRRIADERLTITAAGTSLATETAARAAGIPFLAFDDLATVDLCIDGADEIDPRFRAIKGGGGAMLREKIVASAATRMICIVDASKPVETLARPLPIEVLPFARAYVMGAIRALDGEPVVRPAPSDQGNLLMDCDFGPIADPAGLARALDAVPGLLGHGLFLSEIDALYIGDETGVERRERPSKP
ncbi:ribose-5-phosphate isomerase RpiA [Sphingomonas oryzagri]|uniref:Ribose-5-phosphate isomerase A n=1 Tax=Sphingomonas oryzagri TaxID=3042314 RepID=A0ABT6N6U1_9SPHN|nr:ribose-5-phosphate isomerase RpiA [Sphingomonas oryzagri]MDH7640806.1 ribose-5-phosphate isomerase RpiA [Sphingomonas oryzagri]